MTDDLRKLIAAQRALVRTIDNMPFGHEDTVGRMPDCDVCGDLQRYDERAEAPVCWSCADMELNRLVVELATLEAAPLDPSPPIADEEADVQAVCNHCGYPVPEGVSMHPACAAADRE